MKKSIPLMFIIITWGVALRAGTPIIAPTARESADITLDVRHDHAIGSCRGKLTLSSTGVRYETDRTKDARNWSYEDIQQWRVGPGTHIEILSYEDRSRWRLGEDKNFEFDWTSTGVTPAAVYAFLKARTKRPIEARLTLPDESNDEHQAAYEFPVKHLGVIKGSQGRLIFAADRVIYRSSDQDAARAWRYDDIESITSGGIYDLALTTYEHGKFQYASRRVYNFQLKTALERDAYDDLWRFFNERKGKALFVK